nr:MAG TPA: hypothetical protein [Caudoviricetes sp.]
MARVSMVTRTITATKVNVLCLNIETAEPFNKEVTLSGTYKDEKALQKAAEKAINSDTVKAVHVVDHEETETLYGMTEQEFIERAKILPPRDAKKAE